MQKNESLGTTCLKYEKLREKGRNDLIKTTNEKETRKMNLTDAHELTTETSKV